MDRPGTGLSQAVPANLTQRFLRSHRDSDSAGLGFCSQDPAWEASQSDYSSPSSPCRPLSSRPGEQVIFVT